MDDPEVRASVVAESTPRGNDACRIGGRDARQRTRAAVRVARLAWALLACLTLFAAAAARAGAADDANGEAADRARVSDSIEGRCFAWSLPAHAQLLPDVETAPDLPLAPSEPETSEKYARFEAIVPLPAHAHTVRWFPAIRAPRIASTAWVAQFARSEALPRGPPGSST